DFAVGYGRNGEFNCAKWLIAVADLAAVVNLIRQINRLIRVQDCRATAGVGRVLQSPNDGIVGPIGRDAWRRPEMPVAGCVLADGIGHDQAIGYSVSFQHILTAKKIKCAVEKGRSAVGTVHKRAGDALNYLAVIN